VENAAQPNSTSYPALDTPERILLGPGPSMVHPRVLKAMARPLVGHLDPTFIQVMDRIQSLLRYTFQTENPLTIPVSGTGSAAMETAIANMVEPGDSVLICINGYFGLRLAEMARRYGGEVQTITRPWGEVFSADEVDRALQAHSAKVVAIVQAETSTGAEQPLPDIARVVHARGAVLIVDAVTSLGGVPVRVDEIGIDVCYSGTQKCLGCPPGLGPITIGPRAEEVLRGRTRPVANWYLDLTMVQKYWGKERTYHHTAPISNNFGLYEGLRIVAEEGLENRWARHRSNAERLWSGLESMDLTLHVPPSYRLTTLTTVRVPDGVDEASVRKALLDDHNIEISGGLGELKGKVWRIGLMGYSSTPENVDLLLGALEKILHGS
jgi:alanine-glyoxylate transaminase / serine-glyoxylate transaminase / serine-pyruvate transaminase